MRMALRAAANLFDVGDSISGDVDVSGALRLDSRAVPLELRKDVADAKFGFAEFLSDLLWVGADRDRDVVREHDSRCHGLSIGPPSLTPTETAIRVSAPENWGRGARTPGPRRRAQFPPGPPQGNGSAVGPLTERSS